MKSKVAKRRLLFTLKVFLALVAFFVVFVISAFLFVQTAPGREFTRNQLNKIISGQIVGKFELKHLDKVGFNRIVGRGFVITAPNGDKVIELHDISLNPVWRKLLIGKIHGSSATVNGGVFRLYEKGPTLSIIKALSSPKPIDQRGEPINVLFEDIRGKNLEVQIDVEGFPRFDIEDIQTHVRFELKKIVTIRLDSGSAHTQFPILGDMKIRQLSGGIQTKSLEVLDLSLKMELGELVPAHITYQVPKNVQKPGKPKMTFQFSKDKSPSSFPKLVLKMADSLSPVIDVEFKE